MDIQKLCEEVKKVARLTGKYLKKEQTALKRRDIEMKGVRNYVTYIDKEAERQLVEALSELVPEAGFLTEESTVEQQQKTYTWIIDPLDGTTNYVHGNTPYSISIALMKNDEVVLGVVYDPIMNEMYSATGKRQVFLNRVPLLVNGKDSLDNAYIGFGIPYYPGEKDEQILRNAMRQFHRCSFRIKGSAALEICYVASGGSDAYFHSGLSPWDVAAGTYILQCAGGRCTDFSGGNNYIFGKELVASNGFIHEDVMDNIVR